VTALGLGLLLALGGTNPSVWSYSKSGPVPDPRSAAERLIWTHEAA
jgi:hypothetical protein